MTVIRRVIVLLLLTLGLAVTILVMFAAGYIHTNGWSTPQHEVIFGMVVGFMAGTITTLNVLLVGTYFR